VEIKNVNAAACERPCRGDEKYFYAGHPVSFFLPEYAFGRRRWPVGLQACVKEIRTAVIE